MDNIKFDDDEKNDEKEKSKLSKIIGWLVTIGIGLIIGCLIIAFFDQDFAKIIEENNID